MIILRCIPTGKTRDVWRKNTKLDLGNLSPNLVQDMPPKHMFNFGQIIKLLTPFIFSSLKTEKVKCKQNAMLYAPF